ncbi:MAG: S41 family peptidase [Erysipelotrichaceae bacterium]|nr:S41 family peptidase [Erysipelotrichaceae bacterium]
MAANEQMTVAQLQKRQSRRRILTFFITVGVVITFLLGYAVGQITGSDGVDYGTRSDFSTLESVYNILTKKFYFGEDTPEYRQKLIEDAIKGMVDAQGDIHTSYMTSDELAEFTSSLESKFVGIGVRYVMLNSNVFVLSVISDSPAEAAGILAGDYITAIEGQPCSAIPEDEIPERIKGVKGSTVNITILREGEEFPLAVVRAEIDKTVESEIRDDVGIVYVSSFSTGTGPELGKHLARLYASQIRKLIIDLRGNGGGYASTLDDMCRYFMENGQVVMIEEDRNGKEIIDKVTNSEKYDFDRIVILVDEGSASCSEVFTMALKENCNATVVGVTTYGKGIAQYSKAVADGSALKYTDVIWKSGKGVSIHLTGITPDYEVKLHPALYQTYITMEEDELYSYDSVNSKVAVAQMILDFLGYSVDRMDGYFSAATRTALQSFQSDNGITVSGSLDYDTASQLTSSLIYEWNINKSRHDVQMQKALEIVRE